MALRSIRQDKLTLTAMAVIVLLGLLALCAPLITSLSPDTTDTNNTFAPPYIWPYIQWRMGTDPTTAPLMLGQSGGVPHWLGTDHLGRDQLARLLYGGRISIGIALMAAVIAMLLGATLGGIAGYFGGVVDDIFLWFINTITSVPTIYLLIIVCAIF